MSYAEETLDFSVAGERLLGILARPQNSGDTGVVVIVGGPQYRAGSHRQFVLLSRALAAAGYPTLRFDYRGMGDSPGQQRDFEHVQADIAQAVDALQAACPSVTNIVFWGLCDAASAALMYWDDSRDPRISGMCLLNPWVRSATSQARTQVKHYYLQRLRQPEFWRKLASGGVAWAALGGLLRNLKLAGAGTGAPAASGKPPYQTRMARGWAAFGRPILLILSGDDYTAKEFLEFIAASPDWAGALTQPMLQRLDLPDANHTCSSATWRGSVEAAVLSWLSGSQRPSAHDAGSTP
jgi:exosortase A-associated hydrolase 1